MRGSQLVDHDPNMCLFFPCCASIRTGSVVLELRSELDQEYQDKFRRLPVEIQEFVQDSAACKGKLINSSDCLPVSTATEANRGLESSEKVFDTTL
ncbi:1-phosphatidylinositol 4,5-bisphosphate phosphodiesterase beta-1 [Anabarilius grahami]|uniref:1-phosphatidylinositol 4,5-bisphosphate phosphodiesterase beta-1 n=1 Tax=Anabarilius grahami TaxID=495550 RepID=A0A3N0YWA6_ANAGA|nr:1-phosphatidylinositol 4,5-bisphosphate phosphodiesterase beta-1 [Anabarilius grahami]